MQVKNVAYLRVPWVLPGDPCRVGFCRPQLLPDLLRGIQQANRVAQTLGHLGLAIQAGDPFGLSQDRVRLGKEVGAARELRVPLPSNFTCQLQMLHLIFSDRDQIRAI